MVSTLKERIKLLQSQLKQGEQVQTQVSHLQTQREEHLSEIKLLYSQKSELTTEIMRLKDEINSLKVQLQELLIKEQLHERELSLAGKSQGSSNLQLQLKWRELELQEKDRLILR